MTHTLPARPDVPPASTGAPPHEVPAERAWRWWTALVVVLLVAVGGILGTNTGSSDLRQGLSAGTVLVAPAPSVTVSW